MIVLATGLYWISIGLVCLTGSAIVAHVLRRRGRQERGVWAAGLLAALVLPLTVPLASGVSSTGGTTRGLIGAVRVLELAPISVGTPGIPVLEWLGPVLLSAWAGLSAMLLLRLVEAVRTIGRLRARATSTRLAGGIVKVTDGAGPAVVGFLRPAILVPSWILDLPAERREWILRHEEEHIRGRDPWLLGCVLGARVVMPWNPVVWWFGNSIRSAIEIDCDRRTVGPGGDVRSYGEALLAVAGGLRAVEPLPAWAPAFAERNVPLGHRIEAVTTPRRRVGTFTRLGLGSVALLVVAAACEMPAPTSSERTVEGTPVSSDRDIRDVPADPSADEASATEGVDDSPRLGPAPPPEALARADSVEPRFIPYDTPPQLANSSEVRRTLEAVYPPLLKESGIGGEVTVWLWISEEGQVLNTQIRSDPPGTSGYHALDAAALEVADAMRFAPAMNGDKPSAVWVQIPITFSVRN